MYRSMPLLCLRRSKLLSRLQSLFVILLLLLSCGNVTAISFVRRLQEARLFRRATGSTTCMQQREDAVQTPPPRQWSSSSTTTTTTVHSLLGGFVDSGNTQRLSSLSAMKQSKSATVAVPIVSPVSTKQESAHLQLNSEAMMKHHEENEKEEEQKPTSATVLHTYHDPIANISLSGFNVSKRKFQAWVQHTLPTTSAAMYNASLVSTTTVQVDDPNVRQELRTLWRQRRLLSDRTEVLAEYKSDKEQQQGGVVADSSTKKRGGFPDLLHIYAERLSSIIEDELDEQRIAKGCQVFVNRTGGDTQDRVPQDVLDILDGGLLGWLKREYGSEETDALCYSSMQDLPVKDQYAVFQHFLEWFRSRFPYYYDRCDHCGASAKDDPVVQEQQDANNTEEDADDNGSFLGYVYPSNEELLGKAGRTEIYQCHKCGSFTRFPRYNAASSVIKNRRGRCGEYSMLLYRILRATGHTSRWIVDWADHVWAEVLLNGTWIHLDPCEAAVDKPLLYEEWGKQQTYIVAFHAPFRRAANVSTVPLIEDVTLRYTSDDLEKIRTRRDESDEELSLSMKQTITELERKLDHILR